MIMTSFLLSQYLCRPHVQNRCFFAPAEDPGVRPAAAGDDPVRLAAPLLPGEILAESLSLELFR